MGLFKTKDSTPKKAKQKKNKKQNDNFQSLEKEIGVGYQSVEQGYNQPGFPSNIQNQNSYQQNSAGFDNQYGSIQQQQYQQNYHNNKIMIIFK